MQEQLEVVNSTHRTSCGSMQQQNVDLATQYAAGTGSCVQEFNTPQISRLVDGVNKALLQTNSVAAADKSGGLTGAMDPSQANKSKRRSSVVRFSPNIIENLIIEESGGRSRAEGGPSARNAASGVSVQQQNTESGHVAAGARSAALQAKQQHSQQCAASESNNSVISVEAQDCIAHEGTKQPVADSQSEPQKQPGQSAGTIESKAMLKVPNSSSSNKNSGSKAVHAPTAGAANQKEARSAAQNAGQVSTLELKGAPKYMGNMIVDLDPHLLYHLGRRHRKGVVFKPSGKGDQ